MKPILTAILFTYNHRATIQKCIESLLNQKTKYPYIISIWDDCSTDGTSDICRKYAKNYPDKIKLIVQKENTFLKKYLELQSYNAICSIDTKYFSVIDGDDCWCDENKIEIALNFLEKNEKYSGFAHDTLFVDAMSNTETSYIHDGLKWEVKDEIYFEVNAPFLLTSSRIFRNYNYKNLKILPIDYLVYYYHLSKGPIYYYDKIMAEYMVGSSSTFASGVQNIKELNSMFAFKVAKMFNFEHDDFTTELQKKYDTTNGLGESRYNNLCLLKKMFGIKGGWYLWFILTFAWRFGFLCLNINYIYSRKKAKKCSDTKNKAALLALLKRNRKLNFKIAKKNLFLNICLFIYKKINMPQNMSNYFRNSISRKKRRIEKMKEAAKIINEKLESIKND